MVRLYTLHRRNAGVNALVLLRDTRWRDDRAVISSMEMDLSSSTQLAYTAPNMTLSIHDFKNRIQLMIQTHGYEGWQGGESNMLLSRSLIGRLSNTSHTNFRYNVENVADHLASRGVRTISRQSRTTEELQDQRWIIRPAVLTQTQNPHEARIRTRTDGSLSVRFSGYALRAPETEVIRGNNDEESLEEELALMMTCDWDESQEEEDNDFAVVQQLMTLQDEQESFPIWNDSDDEEDVRFVNPFAEGGGREAEAVYAAEAMEYPIFKTLAFKTESAFSTAESSMTGQRIPREPIMGSPMYPPGSRQPPQFDVPEIRARISHLKGDYAK